jgi:hypothetical protein
MKQSLLRAGWFILRYMGGLLLVTDIAYGIRLWIGMS